MKRCENNTLSHNSKNIYIWLPTHFPSLIHLNSVDNSFLFHSWFPCGKSSFIAIFLLAWLEGCISFYCDLIFAKLNFVCVWGVVITHCLCLQTLLELRPPTESSIIRMWHTGLQAYEYAQLPVGLVCYVHTVSSDSWWLYEWVMFLMSCPQQPCSDPADSCAYSFFYGVNPPCIWSSSFSAAFCFSQHYCLFQKPCHFMMCLK